MYIILPFHANHNSHAVEVYSKIKDIPFPTNVPVRCYRLNKKIYNELELNYYNIHKDYSHSVTLPRFQIANENVEFYEHYLLNNTKNPIIKEFINDFIDNKDYNGSYYYHIAIFYAYEFDKIELNKPVPESLNIDLNGNSIIAFNANITKNNPFESTCESLWFGCDNNSEHNCITNISYTKHNKK